MKPLSNGHIGASHFCFERLSSLRRLVCTLEKGSQSVSFIERLFSLWRLKCTSIIEKGSQKSKCVLYSFL